MRVLSLFDGMSCGRLALDRVGITPTEYLASEVDKYAIQVAKENFPTTKHIGSVVDIDPTELGEIDLLIGGSPCQSFSFAGKMKGMVTKCSQEILTLEQYLQLKAEGFAFEGQSYLFWEYVRLLKAIKPKYFMLENVKMTKKWQDLISKTLGVEPIEINSNLVSAQNRKRLYWTNIPISGLPKDKGILLKGVLEEEVEESYYLSAKALEYMGRLRNGSITKTILRVNHPALLPIWVRVFPMGLLVVIIGLTKGLDSPLGVKQRRHELGLEMTSRADNMFALQAVVVTNLMEVPNNN